MREVLSNLQLLREAGCKCVPANIEQKAEVGPRCTICGTQVVLVKRGAW